MLSRLLILDLALQHPGPNAEFHADLPTGHGLLWSPISWVAQRLGGSVRRTKKWPNHFVSRLQQAFFYQDWKDPKRIKRAKRFFQNYCHFHGGCDNFTRFSPGLTSPSFHQAFSGKKAIGSQKDSVVGVLPKTQNASLEPNIGGSLESPP